ncbi:HupE/UreJ family protein [Compostimonas suwonensis]|uniref:HupE/UreJ protein n=1 Tax=Compostimonas suwonensis TaxID=1048394 RepID=A0A2M9C417_9MICO|nr:HupE/UreJ family protein [Compostimonas suwonensis]PJJ65271.1 HupE/UreJ protein [Compostimonas suwonensis]
MSRRLRPALTIAATIIALGAAAGAVLSATPALAHGFSSVVYVDVTAPDDGSVQTELGLEYDLLVVSAAENYDDPSFFDEGMDLFETGDEAIALNKHKKAVVDYVNDRFTVAAGGAPCEATQVGDFTVEERDGVPYAVLVLDQDCAEGSESHEITSGLFPDDEGYVRDTKTIVTYDLDGQDGSAALDAANPTFSTEQAWTDRFSEFFLLGAEHLLGGLDHILFLLALIVGSRRLRDVVLAATTFTIAHSITFLIAALGFVQVPAFIVEPIIAFSIAVVAAWYLWGLWRHPSRTAAYDPTAPQPSGWLGLDRADWTRLAVVFCFGLVHGLGFAGALGIDEPWSWTLLWSLLVFNVGIEAVQLGIIIVIFPLLTLLRRRSPRVGLWAGALVAAVVTVIGLFWFVQRIFGLE